MTDSSLPVNAALPLAAWSPRGQGSRLAPLQPESQWAEESMNLSLFLQAEGARGRLESVVPVTCEEVPQLLVLLLVLPATGWSCYQLAAASLPSR